MPNRHPALLPRFALFATLFALIRPVGHVAADEPIGQDHPDRPWTQRHAFDRDFALAIYGLGGGGAYRAGGGGARARWEPFDRLGVEVYSEHLWVRDPDGRRHDHPIGFNLYSPFRVHPNVRLRPLFGFCAVFSFLHPTQGDSARVDDVHFGVHAGGGVEVALGRFWSLFADVRVTSYFGHGRSYGGWSAHVGDSIDAWFVAQAAVGLQLHL